MIILRATFLVTLLLTLNITMLICSTNDTEPDPKSNLTRDDTIHIYTELINTTLWTTTATVVSSTSKATTGKPEECYTEIIASSGRIISPSYKGQSRTMIQCYWVVTVPSGYSIRLKFMHFDLPPPSSNDRCIDGFVLYGSYDNQGRKVGGYEVCDDSLPPVYTSVGNQCWIYYQLFADRHVAHFELVFDAVTTDHEHGFSLAWLSMLLIVLPCIGIIFYCYCKKKKKEEQQRQDEEMFQRFRKKHMRNQTILLSKKKNIGDRKQSDVKITLSRPSDDPEYLLKRYFDSKMSSIRGSGAYENFPGNFHVRRVVMPSAYSTDIDASVFLHDTPDNIDRSASYLGDNNFLTIPTKKGRVEPMPSYMSFRQPESISNLGSLSFDPNRAMTGQTSAAMATSRQSFGSLDSIDEVPRYEDPPPYHAHTQTTNTRQSKDVIPYQTSDTSVFSNEHPRTLDRKKKRRKTYTAPSMVGTGSRRRAKNYSLTYSGKRHSNKHERNPHLNSGSFIGPPDMDSYRPGTGHPTFLSSTSLQKLNNFISSTNLQKGKWGDICCLNNSEFAWSPERYFSAQNLAEMRELCKTMPLIHVSSFSSMIREHNAMSYPAGAPSHEYESSSTTNNENMSLINEESDTLGTTKEFDNPAFVLDESPQQDNKNLQRSLDENKSLVDINNNTPVNESGTESKSFVVNEFFPGESQFILLERGETMV